MKESLLSFSWELNSYCVFGFDSTAIFSTELRFKLVFIISTYAKVLAFAFLISFILSITKVSNHQFCCYNLV